MNGTFIFLFIDTLNFSNMAYYKHTRDKYLKVEDVITYKTQARYLVEESMELVADGNDIFSQYKVILAGSQKENVRVGNPYEIDFMIQYDINVTDVIEDTFHLGFVQLKPGRDDGIKFNSMLNRRGQLISDRLMFTFFKTIFRITDQQEYRSKKLRLQLAVTYKFKVMNEFNFRISMNIGAAIPFNIVSNNRYSGGEEHIDLVLSFHCPSYWPACAARWRKNERFLNKISFKQILDHGVSFVCKVPDPTLFDRRNLFRLSFSFAESIIINHVSAEQKEAYRMLKIVRETELKEYILLETLPIGEELTKSFTSYHLKSIFLNLSIRKNGIRSVREWLVLYLEELIICLQKQSIRHHFINDLELLRMMNMDICIDVELKNVFKSYMVGNDELTFEEFRRSIPSHLIFSGIYLNICTILEIIFKTFGDFTGGFIRIKKQM